MPKKQKNGATVFHQAKEYLSEHYIIYENIINNKFFFKPAGEEKSDFEVINDSDLYVEIQEYGIKLSRENLFAILKSSYTEKVNPIKRYFESLPPWDSKTDYIKEFTGFIKVVNSDWFYNQLKKWLVRCIKCVLEDKYFNKQALIFAGQGQNSGKTTLCRFFCPESLTEYRKEQIDNLKNKDTKIELARNFFINLDELAILHKTEDMKNLKSFMTTDFINERLPYERSNVTMPRRCSFIGSTDNFDFLKDKTGNVRWLVIELANVPKPINYDYSKEINIDNIWSQAYYLSMNKEFKEQMTTDEIKENERNNEKYFVNNQESEIIMEYLEKGKKGEDEFMTTGEIWEYLKTVDNAKYYSLLSHMKPETIGRALVQLKFYKESAYRANKKGNLNTYYGYYVKKLDNEPF